jgi:beta-lactamase class D
MARTCSLALLIFAFLLAVPLQAQEIDIDGIFTKHNAVGTLVIERHSHGSRIVHNADRATQPFFPASTFKIPNTLIALELGVVEDLQTRIPWDGVKRRIAAWNKSQTLAQAFRNSTVPIYQEIARTVGKNRMAAALKKLRYGNQNIGEEIDSFWLEGPLQISANEQIVFLKRLYLGELPYSERAMTLTKKAMVRSRSSTKVHRAKTGWTVASDPAIGWYVGWEERGHEVLFFALNMDMTRSSHPMAREGIVRQVLANIPDQTR